MSETKQKIRLHFLAHLRLSLVLGSAKRLSHGLSQKVKSTTVSLNLSVNINAGQLTDQLLAYK